MLTTMPANLLFHYDLAIQASKAAYERGDLKESWAQLERSHIISQMWIVPHLDSHWKMLRFAWATRNYFELAGQALRLALVVPGTLLGRLPVGNPGGSNISVFQPVPLPEDLRQLLAQN